MRDWRSVFVILGLSLALAGLAGEPAAAGERVSSPAALRTFGDWKVGCDNGLSCTAIGLPPRDETAIAYLVVRRDGAAQAVPRLSLKMRPDTSVTSPATLSLQLENAPVAGPGHAAWPAIVQDDGDLVQADIGGEDAARMLRQLAGGKTLRVLLTGQGRAPEEGAVSLSGIVPALRHLDQVQHRTSTVTALIEPGAGDTGAIPPVPPLPMLAALAMEPISPPPEALPAGVTPPDPDDCAGLNPPVPLVIRLSPRLALWGVCYVRGHYNEQSTFWLVEEGAARPAAFPLPEGLSWTDGPAILENPMLSEGRRALESSPRGRGMGDCGAAISWVWTGTDFRLASLAHMDECRGVRMEDWPVTYSTQPTPDPTGGAASGR